VQSAGIGVLVPCGLIQLVLGRPPAPTIGLLLPRLRGLAGFTLFFALQRILFVQPSRRFASEFGFQLFDPPLQSGDRLLLLQDRLLPLLGDVENGQQPLPEFITPEPATKKILSVLLHVHAGP
jgi:hypothetical protein